MGDRDPTTRRSSPTRPASARPWVPRLVLGTVAAVLAACGGASTDPVAATSRAAAQNEIAGVEVFGDLARDHVDGPVDYAQDPPVGGAHAPIWQNCGAYDQPVASENAVHSLEHGAVWITFDPQLPQDDVNQLLARAAVSSHILVSPRGGLPSPVVASAWGVQLQLDGATGDRLDPFLDTYVRGPQTPEPGVTCADGVGDPIEVDETAGPLASRT